MVGFFADQEIQLEINRYKLDIRKYDNFSDSRDHNGGLGPKKPLFRSSTGPKKRDGVDKEISTEYKYEHIFTD